MVEYMVDKYGVDHVAHIIAKGTLSTTSVIRKVLTAYDYEPREVNRVAKMFKQYKDKHSKANVEELCRNVPEFNTYMTGGRGSRIAELKDMMNLEDLISHVSKHAAGIALCSEPISNYVPCMRDNDNPNMLMTQWDKHDLETVGVYKFDFLGLKTLTIIRKTLDNIFNNKGIEITKHNMDSIDKEDPNLYEFLNRFELCGIFQFDAPAGKQMIQRIKPNCFADIVAGEALCRPGVKEADMYLTNKELFETTGEYSITGCSKIDKILAETYGAIVYQEQTMLVMHEMAGWSLGTCDKMRKVRDLEEFRDEFVRFSFGRGYTVEFANYMFSRFSLEYSFNKSHAAAYGDNTVQTLYLATYYPVEFMSAVMSMELLAAESCLEAQIKQCRRMGIEILPPDINRSDMDFKPDGNRIIFPLRGINGVGEAAVEEILSKREEHEGFDTVAYFISYITKRKCNNKVVKQLIKAGCFDNLNTNTRLNLLSQYCKDTTYGSYTYSEDIKRALELEVFGMYLTSHPNQNEPTNTLVVSGVTYIKGIVKEVKQIKDRNGNDMAFIKIDRYMDDVKCVLFSHMFNHIRIFQVGALVRIQGRKDGGSIIIEGVM